jgi:hypothetical protein
MKRNADGRSHRGVFSAKWFNEFPRVFMARGLTACASATGDPSVATQTPFFLLGRDGVKLS